MNTHTDNSTHAARARGITIRRLTEADSPAVRELAARDSAPAPEGDLLGLEVEGRLVAVESLAGYGTALADPFARTAELAALLAFRADQLRARRARARRAPAHGAGRHHRGRRHPLVPLAGDWTAPHRLIKETPR